MLAVVIQAGGESRRMGRDKALMPFLGRPLIRRVVERVAPLADELLVTTNQPDDYAFLGLPLVPDALPGRGALGGLYTALSAARSPAVAVVACDMPFVSLPLLEAEQELLFSSSADAVIPRPGGQTQPFHAVYRRAACLPPIKGMLQAGKLRVDAWFSEVNLLFMTDTEIAAYDPHGLAFWNVNTPEEFLQAEQAAIAIEGIS